MSNPEAQIKAAAEKHAKEREGEYVGNSSLSRAFEAGANFGRRLGLEESCKACRELVLQGTDGCDNCEAGRVSVYRQGKYCIECKHALAAKGERG